MKSGQRTWTQPSFSCNNSVWTRTVLLHSVVIFSFRLVENMVSWRHLIWTFYWNRSPRRSLSHLNGSKARRSSIVILVFTRFYHPLCVLFSRVDEPLSNIAYVVDELELVFHYSASFRASSPFDRFVNAVLSWSSSRSTIYSLFLYPSFYFNYIRIDSCSLHTRWICGSSRLLAFPLSLHSLGCV